MNEIAQSEQVNLIVQRNIVKGISCSQRLIIRRLGKIGDSYWPIF